MAIQIKMKMKKTLQSNTIYGKTEHKIQTQTKSEIEFQHSINKLNVSITEVSLLLDFIEWFVINITNDFLVYFIQSHSMSIIPIMNEKSGNIFCFKILSF